MARGRQLRVEFEDANICLREAAEEFFKHNAAKNLAKDTQETYKRRISHFISSIGEDKPASSLRVQELDNYMYELSTTGVKPITIATDMRHIRRFINFCAKRGYMVEMEVPIPKVEEEIKEPYTEDEMRALLKKPAGANWVEFRSWVMVNYFFSTGQRLSSVLNIKVKDVDLAGRKVKLVHNKDKRQKFMPLSTALVDILNNYIYVSGLEPEDWLFPEYEGGQLKSRSAQEAIAKYNQKRGVSKTSIHLFRHTFAANYIRNGGNPAKLQKLLNHKTIHMTMHYVNLYGDDISADIDIFNPLDNFKKKRVAI